MLKKGRHANNMLTSLPVTASSTPKKRKSRTKLVVLIPQYVRFMYEENVTEYMEVIQLYFCCMLNEIFSNKTLNLKAKINCGDATSWVQLVPINYNSLYSTE